MREAGLLAVDFFILCLAGICLGTIAKFSDPTFGMSGYNYTIIAVCKFNTSVSSVVASLICEIY